MYLKNVLYRLTTLYSNTSKFILFHFYSSFAFIDAISRGGNLTYIDLLSTMRETLEAKYDQIIQMSTGFPRDMNTPFIF